MSNTPSDADLKALLPTVRLDRKQEPKVQVWLTQKDALHFARAVLAKWGAPQPAVREPLSVQEVEQLLAQWSYELHGDRARYLVRMTEHAHGITQKGGKDADAQSN